VKREIIAYIADEILGEDAPPDLAEDTPLLSSGLLDSLSVEQLLLYLEDELGVAFAESDYSAENFETVNAIEALVRRRLEAGPIDDDEARSA
jgi:acyl carrier protein